MPRNRFATSLQRVGLTPLNVEFHAGWRDPTQCLIERNDLNFASSV
jgi:hypothetical protein